MICLLLIWLDFNLAFLGACGRLWEEMTRDISGDVDGQPVEVPEMYRARVTA